jgi:hypothetical protein
MCTKFNCALAIFRNVSLKRAKWYFKVHITYSTKCVKFNFPSRILNLPLGMFESTKGHFEAPMRIQMCKKFNCALAKKPQCAQNLSAHYGVFANAHFNGCHLVI